MPRLSIARSLRSALVGLTLALAVIAALGVASLYDARQQYENTLQRSAALSVAAANLASAGVVEEEVLRDGQGRAAAVAQRQVAATPTASRARTFRSPRGLSRSPTCSTRSRPTGLTGPPLR